MPPVIAIHNAVDAAEVINSGTALKLLFNDIDIVKARLRM